jgi:hypothetical protein
MEVAEVEELRTVLEKVVHTAPAEVGHTVLEEVHTGRYHMAEVTVDHRAAVEEVAHIDPVVVAERRTVLEEEPASHRVEMEAAADNIHLAEDQEDTVLAAVDNIALEEEDIDPEAVDSILPAAVVLRVTSQSSLSISSIGSLTYDRTVDS